MNCTMTLLSNSQKSLNDDSSYVGHTKVFYDDDVEIVTIFVNLKFLLQIFLMQNYIAFFKESLKGWNCIYQYVLKSKSLANLFHVE